MYRVLPRLNSSAAPQPVRALALIKHAAPPGSPAAFGAVPPWSTHSSFVRRVSPASIARKLFPTASFPQTMMRVYTSKVKAKIKARKASGLRKLVPCGRTQESLDKLLEKCTNGKGEPINGLFKNYFYNLAFRAANPDTKVLVKKHNTPVDDTNHRCRSCGCTIADHAKDGAVQQLDEDVVLKTFKGLIAAEKLPKIIEREDQIRTVLAYAEAVRAGKPDNSNVWWSDGQGGRAVLLLTSGMPGIGKTSLLYECVRRLKKHPDKYHAVYVTFSGGNINPISMYYNTAFDKRKTHIDAFGMAILARCVDPKEAMTLLHTTKCDFATAMKIYRRHAAIADDVAVLFFVDEIGRLSSRKRVDLMSALMTEQDKTIATDAPRVGFVFTAVRNVLITRTETLTSRPIRVLPLPPLPIDTWKANPAVKAFAESSPVAKHLVLLCAGHPRSLFDSLPKLALEKWDLRDGEEYNRARRTLFDALKCKPQNAAFLEAVLGKWLRAPNVDRINCLNYAEETRLLREGCAFAGLIAGKFSMLTPLVWSLVAFQGTTPLLQQLSAYYESDKALAVGAEKKFESVMLHYEILQRIAFASRKRSEPVELRNLFRTEHATSNLKFRKVIVPHCSDDRWCVRVDSLTDVDAVINHLTAGKIVVPDDPTELGIEYLSPYLGAAKPKKLVVAAAQCKSQPAVTWGEVNAKWEAAVEPLQKAGVECFAVVYSVSEVTAPQPTSYANGFVFTANDMFTQTAHLGILRTHVEKMSDALKPEYKKLIE